MISNFMSNSKQSYGYQTVVNRPMPCSFCGATVNGKIQEKLDPRTKEVIKECHWVCARCGNVSRVGKIA